MNEFIHYIFSPANIIPTGILTFCVLYWLIVIIGIIDLDMIDIDIDVDVDADVEVGGSGEMGVAWMSKLLHFFNLGRIPFMLWLSIIILITWFLTIFTNNLLLNGTFLIGLLVFIVALIISVVIAKPLMFPLVKMFDSLDKSDGLESVVGQIAEVVYPNKGKQPGEVQISYEGSQIRIFAVPADPEKDLIRNEKVLVIAPTDNDPKIYLVEPYT